VAGPKRKSGPLGKDSGFLSSPQVKAVIGVAKQIYSGLAKSAELMAMLRNYEKEPVWSKMPVRDLNEQQAFDLLLHLVYWGEILVDEIFRADASGRIVYPKPGQQVKVRTKMAGVEFYQASDVGFPGNHPSATFTPTPAFALVLYRLAQRLGGGYFGATRIVWGGIGHGGAGKVLNCHEIGTCVDFYGAYTRHGKFDVLPDWGKKPIFNADDKPRKVPNWTDDKWGNEAQTYYRLRSSDPGLAYWFFADVYKFAYEQCTVGSTDVPELKEGQRVLAGTIIHPDYAGAKLRHSHLEHMHFQLGDAYVKA
jgi:hypothetical protein